MRINIFSTLLSSLTLCFSYTSSTPPGTCPWSSTPKRLRHPACASPELIQKLINPSSSSSSSSLFPLPPPWKGPTNCVNGTCVYTNAKQNGGMALLTSPVFAEIIIRDYVYDEVREEGEEERTFYAEEIQGKGVGLRAGRKIGKGEVLMARMPTFVARTGGLVQLERRVRDRMYETALSGLPKPRRDAFMAQMGTDVHDKINTNSFQVYVLGAGEQAKPDRERDEDAASHLTCYPDVARFNHDCRPNVHYRINGITITTVAARDIFPGEELSVSYVDVFLPSKERKDRIRRWGFDCMCALCQGRKNETIASDKRLRRIEQIKADLNNFKEMKVTAETGAEYVSLHEEEGLHAHLGSAYTRAALNFALFGDEGRAREYAAKAAEELDIEKGPESADARAMRGLAEDPKAHWTWGKRRVVEKKSS